MLSDFTSDQHDSPQCGHCGVPLAGRFTFCPSCHRRAGEPLDTRPAPPPLKVPLGDPQPAMDARLPARKIWSPSSRELADSYEFIEEPVVALTAFQRLRQPIVLGASALVVTSAVYVGFIHSNDSTVSTPIEVTGKVQRQPVAPLAVVPQKKLPMVAAQKPSGAAAEKPALVQAQKPAIAAAPQPTAVASIGPTPAGSPPIPPATSPTIPRRLASNGSDAKRNPGSQSGSPPDKPRTDVSRHIRAARADLQQNNLSATKARLAAAIAAQPDNRDAQNLRSTVSAREQQRDALLSLARGCGYIARWGCVSHNAGYALQIDSSSKEAQRLVMLAQRETELQMPPPAEPASGPPPDTRDPNSHH